MSNLKFMKKNHYLFIFSLASLFFLVSCGSPRQTGAISNEQLSSEDDVNPMQLNRSLADILRKNTSLQVVGRGNDIKVYVRGMSSINLNTQPLYVVDDVPIGNSYASANSLLNPNDILKVKVLRSISELTYWGENGNHGVILITTRNKK